MNVIDRIVQTSLTHERIASAAGMSRAHLTKIIHRNRVPSLQALARLAKAVGATEEEIGRTVMDLGDVHSPNCAAAGPHTEATGGES
jgi:transcriptional regulator with XRE-family HTH domain